MTEAQVKQANTEEAKPANTTEAPRQKMPSFPSVSSLIGKKSQVRRKITCPLSGDAAPKIDYKNIPLMQRYTSDRGKILPSRITNVSQKKQRQLAVAIKRSRYLALMPYIDN